MAAQKGKDLLIKVDMDGAGTFATLAGLRATKLAFNTQTIDATSIDSQGQWRELLAGAGVRSATVSGSGIFKDSASDARAREIFFAGDLPAFEITIPDFGIVSGPFQIASLEYQGDHDGEATYELSLASAGALTFTAL